MSLRALPSEHLERYRPSAATALTSQLLARRAAQRALSLPQSTARQGGGLLPMYP
jgi:hypothetical protein